MIGVRSPANEVPDPRLPTMMRRDLGANRQLPLAQQRDPPRPI
eukprot:gene20076-biopygen5553